MLTDSMSSKWQPPLARRRISPRVNLKFVPSGVLFYYIRRNEIIAIHFRTLLFSSSALLPENTTELKLQGVVYWNASKFKCFTLLGPIAVCVVSLFYEGRHVVGAHEIWRSPFSQTCLLVGVTVTLFIGKSWSVENDDTGEPRVLSKVQQNNKNSSA